jgi:Tfp pilus assembly protein PilV
MFLKNNKKEYKKTIAGFTLVESLVAISILMVAIVTPMTIAQKGLSSAMYSKDQMTASFLAQDAIEFIKNKRDEIGLVIGGGIREDKDWLNSISGCTDDNNCDIDTITGEIKAAGEPLSVNRDSDGNFLYYGQSSGDNFSTSKFTRKINIVYKTLKGDSDGSSVSDEALVTVTVSWQNGASPESVVVKSFIYNYW